jgi:hypothetical protein
MPAQHARPRRCSNGTAPFSLNLRQSHPSLTPILSNELHARLVLSGADGWARQLA